MLIFKITNGIIHARRGEAIINIDLSKTQNYLEWLKKILYIDFKASNSANKNIRTVKRGQVYYCELGQGIGSEEGKNRPCVIIQNDAGNIHSPNTIVAPITNEAGTASVTVDIVGNYLYTDKDGKPDKLTGHILLGNIVTVSKARLGDYICELTNEVDEMNEKILTSLGIFKEYKKLKDTIVKDKAFIKKIIDENYKLKKSIEKKSEI